MNQHLDLNDLKIESPNETDSNDTLSEYTEGHGLSEIGASCQSGSNSCGQGSCTATKLA
jgi:hypothetical protein